MRPINYPPSPDCISELANYVHIKANWTYSYQQLQKLNLALNQAFEDDDSFSVVVVGSFGRMEASTESDLDYIIITNDKSAINANSVRKVISDTADTHNIRLPNENGVFSITKPIQSIIENIGNDLDDLASLAQRLLLLMESRPIYNERLFISTLNDILRKYLDLVIRNPKKEAIFFLNDLIRYFRSIAVNYQFNFWKENEKWALRNVKLRHSRVLIYAGLLFLIMNSSKERDNKFEYIYRNIYKTPIERIIAVYLDNNDHGFYKILGAYDIFLGRINEKNVRDQLQVEYENRYNNPYYAELKVTSDLFQAELTRFIFSQKGKWTEQIFEYLIF